MKLNTTLAYSYLQLRLAGTLSNNKGLATAAQTCDMLGIATVNSYFELMTMTIGFTLEEAVYLCSSDLTKEQISEFYANIYKGIRL